VSVILISVNKSIKLHFLPRFQEFAYDFAKSFYGIGELITQALFFFVKEKFIYSNLLIQKP